MKSICVIGSINRDIVISVKSMPKGGESIISKEINYYCGGKGANAALALSKLNEQVIYYGCVGKDNNGDILVKNLENKGIDISHIKRSNLETGMCFIILEENGENRIIVSAGSNEDISIRDIRKDVRPLIEKSSMVLIQLEISLDAIEEIIKVCNELNKTLVIDAGPVRGINPKVLIGATYLSPNKTELEALVGRDLKDKEEIINASKELLNIGIKSILVKLGDKGSIYIDEKQIIKVDAFKVKVVDTTAAGDSYMAGFCKAIMEGEDIRNSMIYASKCGAIAVTRSGASDSLPTEEEIKNFEKLFLVKI